MPAAVYLLWLDMASARVSFFIARTSGATGNLVSPKPEQTYELPHYLCPAIILQIAFTTLSPLFINVLQREWAFLAQSGPWTTLAFRWSSRAFQIPRAHSEDPSFTYTLRIQDHA